MRATLSRRAVLAGATTLGTGALLPGGARAQGDTAFLRVSRAATGRDDLAAFLAESFRAGLARDIPDLDESVARIDARLGAGDAEALEAALRGTPLHATLMAIVRAWYAGETGAEGDRIVHAYDRALAFDAARDVVPVPTYAAGGPAHWTAPVTAAIDTLPEGLR